MHSPGRDRVLLFALVVFAALSLGLKAMLGPTMRAPATNGPGSVTAQILSILEAQGFATSVRPLKIESSIVYAARGNCTLSARDAFDAAATEATFSDDARRIGQVRYLYRSGEFRTPPTLRIHFAVIESSMLRAIGLRPQLHVPVALASSSGCGTNAFGLQDLRTAG